MIWLDEARARAQLETAHATWCVLALLAGARRSDLPDWDDPADALDPPEDDPAPRERDPAARAAEIAAFVAATGGDAG